MECSIGRLAIALSLLLPVAAAAQKPDDGFSPEALLFEEIPTVVTATRTERSLRDVPNAMTVITAREIRESGAASLGEALQIVPGLEIMRLSKSDVNMSARGFNGANNSNLLVMVDGRTAYLDFFGRVLWESLNVTMEDIERIEVIRGPGSALYGANAFLGTINIITKRARDLPSAYVQTGLGPDTRYVTSTVARSFGASSLKASARYRQLDYFRNVNNTSVAVDHNRHATDSRTQLFRGTFEHAFSDDSELRITAGEVEQRSQIYTEIGSFDYEGPEYTLEVDWQRGAWKAQAFYTRLDFDLEGLPSGLAPAVPVELRDRLVSDTLDLELQREWDLGQHQLLLGSNVRRLSTDSPMVLGDRETDTLYALFGQDEYRVNDWLTAFVGLRADEHPKSGLHLSPRASLVARIGESDRLRASFARSFRNPTQVLNYASLNLQGLVGPPPAVTLAQVSGSEDLDPVWVTSYDLGYQRAIHPRLTARLDLFYNIIDDHSSFVALSAGPPSVLGFINTRRTVAYGSELTLEFTPTDSMRGFATYSFQEADGRDRGVMPRHKATFGLRGSAGERLRYALTGVLVGHADFETGTVIAYPESKVRSRFTVDGFLAYRLNDRLELGLKARNLFHQVRRQHPYGDEIGSEVLGTLTLEF